MRLLPEVIDDLSPHVEAGVITTSGHLLEHLLDGQHGSPPGLADRFAKGRLGEVLASRIGRGPVRSIARDSQRRARGEVRVRVLAAVTGRRYAAPALPPAARGAAWVIQ